MTAVEDQLITLAMAQIGSQTLVHNRHQFEICARWQRSDPSLNGEVLVGPEIERWSIGNNYRIIHTIKAEGLADHPISKAHSIQQCSVITIHRVVAVAFRPP